MTVRLAANKHGGLALARLLTSLSLLSHSHSSRRIYVRGKADRVHTMRVQAFMTQAADQGVLLVSVGTIAHLGEPALS